MNKALHTLFLVSFYLCTTAQDNVLLQNYKYRINQYKYLNASLQGRAYKWLDYNTVPKYKEHNINSGLNGEFGFYTITEKKYQSIFANMQSLFNYSKNNNATNLNRNKGFNVSTIIGYNCQWFKGINFLQLSSFIGTSNNISKNTSSNNQFSNSNSSNPQINVSIGAGIGRLENVTDMQNALWLTRNLNKERVLKNTLSNEDLQGLAKTITAANNYRILDGRRRRKYILKSVDNFLQKNNLINTADINYFNALNDVLFFANNIERISGNKKYVLLRSGLINANIKGENKNGNLDVTKQESLNKSIGATFGFEKHKPINLTRQIDYGIAINGNKSYTNYKDKRYLNSSLISEQNSNENLLSLSASYFFNYGIYPNTRTVINFGVNGEHGKEGLTAINSVFHHIEFGTTVDYFINYNTRFYVRLYENYNYSKLNRYQYNDNKKLLLSFNSGINISI